MFEDLIQGIFGDLNLDSTIERPTGPLTNFNTDILNFDFNQEVQQNQLGLSELKFDDPDAVKLFDQNELTDISNNIDNLLGGI